MGPAATLGAYAAALVLVFGAAVGVGNAVGPVGALQQAPSPSADEHSADEHSADEASADEHSAGTPGPAQPAVGGLAVAQDGYALELASPTVAPGSSTLSFTVEGPDGKPLTDYTRTHDKDLHLIVVRRDLTGYQHLHPERDASGTWTVPLTLTAPGPYKVFADFTPAGRERALTLAADLTVPGDYMPQPLPGPTSSTSVDDYEVALEGRLVAGTSSSVTLTVTRGGEPVTDLEPYLGAYGHLVALRAGDLAYLHVHPDDELEDPATQAGPDITFTADVPSAAAYRLFLDFAHAGTVRTAELTTVAGGEDETVAGGEDETVAAEPSEPDAPHDH